MDQSEQMNNVGLESTAPHPLYTHSFTHRLRQRRDAAAVLVGATARCGILSLQPTGSRRRARLRGLTCGVARLGARSRLSIVQVHTRRTPPQLCRQLRRALGRGRRLRLWSWRGLRPRRAPRRRLVLGPVRDHPGPSRVAASSAATTDRPRGPPGPE